jgi:AcrR family transcriptional regulator
MDPNKLLEHKNAEIILNKSWHLFQQKGYRGISVDELCLQCGITKPTLYYYFGDKENLFIEVLQYQLQRFHAVLSQPGSLAERLQFFANSIFEIFETEYNVLMHDREHIKQPENQRRIRQAFHQELFDPLNAIMQTGINQGEMDGDNAEMFSLIFLGTVNHFIGRAGSSPAEKSALAHQLTTYFLNGTKKQQRGA